MDTIQGTALVLCHLRSIFVLLFTMFILQAFNESLYE